MARAGIVFGLAAVVAFLGSLLLGDILPCINIVLAFGSVIALGWGAGYTAAKTTGVLPGQGLGRGAGAGAIAGVVSLIGLTVAMLILVNIPAVQAQIAIAFQQAAQQNPELAEFDPTTLGAAAGIFTGFLCGFINLVLMVIGGLIGGAMWKGRPGTSEPSVVDYGPTGTPGIGTRPYGETEPRSRESDATEGGVRIYDTDDQNRPR